MSKLYAIQILLIFGFVGLIGALPTISDALSQMVPQANYAQMFHPAVFAQSSDVSASDREETALRIPENMTQTASLDLQGE